MSKTTIQRHDIPVGRQLDPEVIAFRRQFDDHSPLDEIIREGARKMLQAAIDAEVDSFIQDYQHRRDEDGRRLVVKNGSLPAREILTGAGSIPVQQGRVRDNSTDRNSRVEFSPNGPRGCPACLPQTDRCHRRVDPLAVPQRHLHRRLRRGPASARRRAGQGTPAPTSPFGSSSSGGTNTTSG